MRLVHIPYDTLADCEGLWKPFLPLVAERTRFTVEELASEAYDDTIQLHLVMDGPIPRAIVGTRIILTHGRLSGEILWCAGEGAREWFSLMPDLEAWLRGLGCRSVKAVCRAGWKPMLKRDGYRQTHIVMEKDL